MHEVLIDLIDIDPQNVYTPDGTIAKESIFDFCKDYEKKIEKLGGLDLTLVEFGPSGNLAFNEPGSQINSSTRLMLLGSESRHNFAKLFHSNEAVPHSAITMGISTLLGAKKVIVVGWGETISPYVRQAIEAPASDTVPASFLQSHKESKFVLDLSSAEHLTRLSTPWLVTSCEWDDKLIRRAIVWLCRITGKPILKLTNKDYNDNGLSELLALFGSAYNVNIKIFNDLQHTITGWPGGKPNADDTFRPERAKPYPKKVIVFSPHPDDDVISMGGTLKRLVDQHHDVHVAYETSGNIAVGDEDMMRYVMLMGGIAKDFCFDTPEFMAKHAEITKFVKEKKDGDIDTPDIRHLKTLIRQGEARTACNYIGVKPENMFTVSIMPCVAKKGESNMELFYGEYAGHETDVVLTTRELTRMIRSAHIDPASLVDRECDPLMKEWTGAGVIFGTTGGVMEAALRSAHYLVTGRNPDPDAFKIVRNPGGQPGVVEAEIQLGDATVRAAVVSGLGNTRKLIEAIEHGEVHYDFVEVMACPGGCVGGGGQPIHDGEELARTRGENLYFLDKNAPLRFSHENPDVLRLYRDFFEKPLSHKSHMLLHTDHNAWEMPR